ncbi:endonuclease toxin domain-containing protein [Gluconobacter wancherniae]|uniref:endonuclease toxin domain-containing protein n=1 Tax=Gluconobacter wancherniae TaxID=1307955 RepID=UPI001B8C138C|nr:hypothetical protein [Gluconobacter wancherniae]MBS1095179.1 hypothetical protein [Gluconobacter wancherniae]
MSDQIFSAPADNNSNNIPIQSSGWGVVGIDKKFNNNDTLLQSHNISARELIFSSRGENNLLFKGNDNGFKNIDYWKDSQEIHNILDNLLKSMKELPPSPVVPDTSPPCDLASKNIISYDGKSTSPLISLYSTGYDEPIYDQGGEGSTIWYSSGNPFSFTNIDPAHSYDANGADRQYLGNNGYIWAWDGIESGGLPQIETRGISNETVNKYTLQYFDGESGSVIPERLLDRTLTVQEHADWVSVINQDIKHNNWTPARVWLQIYNTISHYPEVTTYLNNFQNQILGRTDGNFDTQWDAWAQNTMAHGYTLDEMRSNLAHSDAASASINQMMINVRGFALGNNDADNSWLASTEDQLAAGQATLASVRNDVVHWDVERSAYLNNMMTNVRGYGLSGSDQDNYWVSVTENALSSGNENFAQVRNDLGHSSQAYNTIKGIYRNIANFTAYDYQIATWEDAIGNGGWNYSNMLSDISHGAEASVQYQQTYSDWGQDAPNADELQTAGTAMFHIQQAWTIVNSQTQAQLLAEASQYQAPAANGSVPEYISVVASSLDQATDLMASMLSEPMMDLADTAQDVRDLVAQGGATLLNSAIDQGVAKTIVQQDRDNPQTPCDDVQEFRELHTKNVTNIGQITSANAQWQTVNQKDWPSSYATNGIVWNASGAGNGPASQGLPYEAYVQQKLNGGAATGDYVWLQDHRGNWKTFDHWNGISGDAVSDKVLNTDRSSFKDATQDNPAGNPANIKYQIWKDMKEMAMKYRGDNSRQGTDIPIRFTQDNISAYTFELGVRADTTTDAQWKQICEAYQGAAAKMATYELNGNKPLDFEIDAIS